VNCADKASGFACTLPPGHGGAHIAHDLAGDEVQRWGGSACCDALAAEVKRLREALITYGGHKTGECWEGGNRCICGYRDALHKEARR
jgi:hypothetical protein